jgi:hypothetical protein
VDRKRGERYSQKFRCQTDLCPSPTVSEFTEVRQCANKTVSTEGFTAARCEDLFRSNVASRELISEPSEGLAEAQAGGIERNTGTFLDLSPRTAFQPELEGSLASMCHNFPGLPLEPLTKPLLQR